MDVFGRCAQQRVKTENFSLKGFCCFVPAPLFVVLDLEVRYKMRCSSET